MGFRMNNEDQMVIIENGDVGIGITTPGKKLEVNNAIKLTNSGGQDENDGVICTGTFGQVLSIVGIKTDGTHRKIGLWGEITQQQNAGTNTWKGNQYFDGYIGIGTKSPQVPLYIASSREITYKQKRDAWGMHKASDNKLNWLYYIDPQIRNISIEAEGDIFSYSAIYVTSDARLKKDIHPTISLADLERLKAIEIVDYKKIDTIAENGMFKKVIARQVQEVYPLAVQQATQNFIPSVFQASASIDKLGTNEYGLTVTNPHNLAVEDILELKYYPGNKSEQVKVSKILSPTQFEVKSTSALDTLEYVFVYRKQVDDLYSVDYDAIAMLNVFATQEIAKQMDALQTENQSLASRVATLEKQLKDMEILKASVARFLAQE